MNIRILFFSAFLTIFSIFGQQIDTIWLRTVLESKPELFGEILKNQDKYKVQILYTRINRKANSNPEFTTFGYCPDSQYYFYPASTVKLPAAVLALEKINYLKESRLKTAPMKIESEFTKNTFNVSDTLPLHLLPTIENYIKRIFLVSDNDSYNYLYEFLGQEYIKKRLTEKGFLQTNIISRLSVSLSPEQNRITGPVFFYDGEDIIYKQSRDTNKTIIMNSMKGLHAGIGYYRGDSLITQPKDFTYLNSFSIFDQHSFILRLFFPESFPPEKQFNLTEDDYQLLYRYMSLFPDESEFSEYKDTMHYWDSYVKFFIYGDTKEPLDGSVRIFNKVGLAYGFLIDNAYIIDFKHNREFVLSAVIYVNEDQIFNDDKYEYDTVGFPFLAKLGRILLEYERSRELQHLPDFSRFGFFNTAGKLK